MEITDKVSKKETKELQNSKDNYEVKDLGKKKPFPKTRKFGGKTYHTPSFHKDKKTAQYIAKKYRGRKGAAARVVKGKNILGDTRYAVYRRGGMAGTARRIVKRKG